MHVIREPMPGVKLLALEPRRDPRGWFARAFCRRRLAELGVDLAVEQANMSASERRRTLRGLHYQLDPSAETKLVTCPSGALHDVVLDLRPHSPTYRRHAAFELSAANGRMVVVPPGCAHGFLTLPEDALAFYFVSAAYAPELERGVRWDDPAFAIPWPERPAIVSERDRSHPDFDPARHLAA